MHWRARYEIRGVDAERRRYFFLDDQRRYDDACLVADMARHLFRHHVVVWDNVERRTLYDSRLMATKWPWDRASAVSVGTNDETPAHLAVSGGVVGLG